MVKMNYYSKKETYKTGDRENWCMVRQNLVRKCGICSGAHIKNIFRAEFLFRLLTEIIGFSIFRRS